MPPTLGDELPGCGAPRGRWRPAARLLARLEALLWGVGAALLGIASWMLADAHWYQLRAGQALLTVDRATVAFAPPGVAEGTPLARLLVPRLELDVVVAEGTSDQVLRRAVGRLPGSARLGESGNVALAGHRDTFFRPLERIRAGDLVVVERGGERLHYTVEWAAVIDPSEVEVIGPADYAALTLVTCYPFRYVGEAPYRFVVRARRSEAPGAAATG